MSKLFIHFPPGALTATDPATIAVSWRRVENDTTSAIDAPNDLDQKNSGESALGQLLDRFPAQQLVLILSAADIYLTSVTLNRQQSRHLSRALPYLLEGDLLDDIETLEFVNGKPKSNIYPVAVFNRQAMQQLVDFLIQQQATLARVLVDANLLSADAPLCWHLSDQSMLIDPEGIAVVLDHDSAAMLTGQHTNDDNNYQLIDDKQAWAIMLAGAQRPVLDLMQPRWRSKKQLQDNLAANIWQHWRTAAIAAVAIVAMGWVAMSVQYFRYQAATNALDQQSAALFQSMFPSDQATAKVRAQFRNHLSRLTASGNNTTSFLSIIERAGPALATQRLLGTRITRMQYDQRNHRMLLDVSAASYPLLQQLREQLTAAKLTAEVNVAKTQGKRVSARLNVEQG